MSGKTLTNASRTWSEIKAGGGDKRRTVPPNGPLVVVGGGGSSGTEWDSAVLVVRGGQEAVGRWGVKKTGEICMLCNKAGCRINAQN